MSRMSLLIVTFLVPHTIAEWVAPRSAKTHVMDPKGGILGFSKQPPSADSTAGLYFRTAEQIGPARPLGRYVFVGGQAWNGVWTSRKVALLAN